MALLLAGSAPSYGQITITEINPDQSTLDASDPDGATGGRVNGLASVAGNNRIFYAASEWGGIYRSTDAGRSWGRLNNHLPTATWDIEVNPANANRLYATSFYDGRVNSLAGINVSTDGGNTWTHPTTATPPVGFCAGAARRDEPSAFGISVNPANPQNVFIGTNCGLAISNNGGTSWQYVDPTPANPADDIWDVVVHHNGIIDLCGNDGHRRSTDGGTTWTTATGTALPSGICSLTASPDESYVLFAVAGTSIFESDDGGANWSTQFVNPSAQGRIPFVVTNQRSGAAFDLWFGDISLWRANCTTPAMPAPGGAARCPASNTWAGPFTRAAGGHDDTGDIVFDTGAANDACPALFSSDGGVYFNTLTTSPACHTPVWEQPNVTPHGLWLFGMAGADRAGQNNEDLYFGCQDNGTFATLNAGVNSPPWANRNCCDGFDDVADPTRVIYSLCCFGPPANRLFISKPGMVGTVQINNTPPGIIPGFTAPDIIDQFGPNSYILLTTSGLFITTNVTAIPIVWTQLGAATSPAGACGVQAAAATAGTPTTFYVQAGFCSGSQPDTLWRFTGTAAGGSWQLVNPPGGVGGFGIFAVDPGNPNRLFASHLRPTGPQMILSTDGGATWVNNAALDNLMTGGGLFRYSNQRGPTSFTGFNGYVQPALVAYDPVDQNTLLAGGADSGIFLSTNGGVNWTVVTNNSGSSTNPHIPRPQFAYFDHEGLKNDIYIGTQGRGLWRLSRGSTRIRDDLFLYRPGNGAAWVARSNGDGTFTGVYTVGDNGSAPPNGIAGYDLLSPNDRVFPFDYDGDGKDDLFLYRPGSGAAWVARSNGDGTFTGVYTVGDNGSAPPNGIAGYDLLSPGDQVLPFDYNGDGKDDLFLYRPGSGAAWVARSNGDGTFTGVYTVGDNGSAPPNGIAGYDLLSSNDRVLPLDYNGDGKDDLFLYRPGSGAAWVARSNGDGTFTGVYTVGDNGSAPPNGIAGYDLLSSGDKVLVFDYDGDGKDDLFLYRPGNGAAWVARSNGDGTFTGVYTVGDNGPASPNGIAGYDLLSSNDQVLPFDYNSDGRYDLFLYRPGSGAAWVARSNGDGTFTGVYTVGDNGSAPPNGIAGYDLLSSGDRVLVFDYNKDGKDDLFLYRPGSGAAWVARSNGDGTFTGVYTVGDNGSAPPNGIAGYDLLSPADRVLALDYNK